jgi:bacterioferritin-associated ferredoxin
MMATEQQILAFLQTPGLSDQQIATELQRIGATAQQVSNVTGVPVDQVQSRIAAVASVPVEQGLLNYLQTPNLTDAQIAAEIQRLGASAQQVSNVTGVPVNQVNTRVQTANYTPAEMGFFNFLQTPGLTDAQIAAEANRLGVLPQQVSNITGVPLADAQNRFFTEFLRTPDLTDGQIAAEMARLGVSGQQASTITGVPVADVTNRFNTALPFANAGAPSNMGTYTPPPAGSQTPATFAENFSNYVSIPIGAQYNPNVTAGGASPYSQIRAQMQPIGNPYAGTVGGQFMGGYDPTIYDPNLLNNFVRQRAAELAAAGMPAPLGFDGGGGDSGLGGGDSGDSGSGVSAADAAAAAAADAAAAASGVGTGPGTGAGYFMGGLIDRVAGKNPAGPDDGQINAQVGEYVVKKSSVNKYGKGLLDKINDGKIPAKKMKSLLG